MSKQRFNLQLGSVHTILDCDFYYKNVSIKVINILLADHIQLGKMTNNGQIPSNAVAYIIRMHRCPDGRGFIIFFFRP